MKLFIINLKNLGFIFIAALLLTSCGGGGGGGGGTTTPGTVSITSISPLGMVASTTARSLAITGDNFVSGMTVTVSNSLGGTYTTGTIAVSTQMITTNVTIATAPTDRYVTVTVKSSTGTILASTTLGVASVSKVLLTSPTPLSTDIQNIFTNSCSSCHGSSGNLALSTATLSANNLIETPSSTSSGCSGRTRVKAGDPRASSSLLIDKLTNNATCGSLGKMTGSPTVMTSTEINAIIEWVAGGAN